MNEDAVKSTSMLDRLVGSRIFEIERRADMFVVIGCDGAFEAQFTSEEMQQLGEDIIQLALSDNTDTDVLEAGSGIV